MLYSVRYLLLVGLLVASTTTASSTSSRINESTFTYAGVVGKAQARFTLSIVSSSWGVRGIVGSYHLLSHPNTEYILLGGKFVGTRLTIDEYTADTKTARIFLYGSLQTGFVGKMLNTTNLKQLNVALFGEKIP